LTLKIDDAKAEQQIPVARRHRDSHPNDDDADRGDAVRQARNDELSLTGNPASSVEPPGSRSDRTSALADPTPPDQWAALGSNMQRRRAEQGR
jgi:hypothetical protein